MPLRREIFLHFLILFLISSGVIWVRTATVRESYRFIQQERDLRKVQQDIQTNRVQWLKATAPKKLESWASELKLFPPKPPQVLRYEPEKSRR